MSEDPQPETDATSKGEPATPVTEPSWSEVSGACAAAAIPSGSRIQRSELYNRHFIICLSKPNI